MSRYLVMAFLGACMLVIVSVVAGIESGYYGRALFLAGIWIACGLLALRAIRREMERTDG